MNDQSPLQPPPNQPPPPPGAVPPGAVPPLGAVPPPLEEPPLGAVPPPPPEAEPQPPYRAEASSFTDLVARNQTAVMLGAFAVGVFFGVLMRR